jgi:hypothetical protein
MITETRKRRIRCLTFVLAFSYFIANQAGTGGSVISQQQSEEKPAEQVYKNIQVLKGVPASRLMQAMMRFSQFLGVDCVYCHVPNQFESEEKPAKQTTRRMLQLVRTINQELNTNNVTCYTCHRGQPKPASLPPAPAITQPKFDDKPPELTKPSTLPTIDQVIDKYLRALGGKSALQKVRTRVMRGSLITQGGLMAPLEIYEKAPNKSFTTFRNPMGVTLMGFDGAIGWTRSPEQGLRELDGKELVFRRFESEFYKELKLKERYPKMVMLGVAKLGDHENYVIEATTAEGNAETLYFDTQTGLLVRQDFTVENQQSRGTIQTRFADYREANGVKLPFVIHRSRPGFTFSYKFDEVKLNVPINDAKFSRPSTP